MAVSFSSAIPPEGFSDSLPNETALLHDHLQRLYSLFESRGFRHVETPILESFDLLRAYEGGFDERSAMKLVSRDGSVLVVRPDSTLPVLRLASLYFAESEAPIRLAYQQKILRLGVGGTHEKRELTQAGIELIGGSSPEEDAEALILAIDALDALGLNDFQIDVGHVGFMDGLMEEAGLSAAQTAHLRQMVERKDALSIELALSHLGKDALRGAMKRLPMLFGGVEVIAEARRMTANSACHAALDHLERVIEILSRAGKSEAITFDLGMAQSIDYYTGIVMSGICGAVNRPLLSGGRYDALPKAFGMNHGAVGFAINMDSVRQALDAQGRLRL